MKNSVYGLTAAAVTLAAALSLTLAGPHRAYGAPRAIQGDNGLAVTVLSPTPRTSFSGTKPVEISAFYQGTTGDQITTVELLVDGTSAATKRLEAPETRGVISFLIDASALTPGTHRIVIRATGADGEIVSAKSSFIFAAPAADEVGTLPTLGATTPIDGVSAAPELSFINPTVNGQISGTVKIQVNTHDASGKMPYVSLFVDRAFKTLKNYPPYEFEWDTTASPNGYHTLDAFGYDDEQNVGHAKSMRVFVNNPGGRTERRTDLQDGLPTVKRTAKPATAIRPRAKTPVTGTTLLASRANHASTELAMPDMAKQNDLLNGTSTLSLAPTLSDPFVSTKTTSPRVMPSGKKAFSPVTSARAKSTLPSPAMMAATDVDAVQPLSVTQIAKSLDLSSETSKLTLAPGLSNPFLPSTASHAASSVNTPRRTVSSAGTLAQESTSEEMTQTPALITGSNLAADTAHLQVTPGLSNPTVGIAPSASTATPVHQSAATGTFAAAATEAADSTVSTPGLLQMSDARVPLASLSSPFLVAPTLRRTQPHVTINAVSAASIVRISAHPIRIHTAGTGNLLRSKGQTSLLLNNKMLRLDRPISEQGSILFSPLRQIFQFGGGSLDWQSSTGTVHAVNSSKDILLTVGQKSMTVNNANVLLPSAPYLDAGRTMVPFSFFSEAMDMNVQYDATTGHVLITSKK